MPRPKIHNYVLTPAMKEALRTVNIEVVCPRCGERGLLRPHIGYLAVRHYNTVHLVPPDKVAELIAEARKQIEERIEGLKRVLTIFSDFGKEGPQAEAESEAEDEVDDEAEPKPDEAKLAEIEAKYEKELREVASEDGEDSE